MCYRNIINLLSRITNQSSTQNQNTSLSTETSQNIDNNKIFNMSNSKSANRSKLLLYGQELLKKYNLEIYRNQFEYDIEILHDERKLRDFLEDTLNIRVGGCFPIVIVSKTLPNEGIKWHIDDCQIVTCKQPPTYNTECYIHLEGYKYLYFNNSYKKLPLYTILFYTSTYGEDFEGGLLTLSDGLQIKPKKGHGFMMDSRETHMVTPILKGERHVTVVKIY